MLREVGKGGDQGRGAQGVRDELCPGLGGLLTHNKARRTVGRRSPPSSHPQASVPLPLSQGSAFTRLLTCVPSRPSALITPSSSRPSKLTLEGQILLAD